MLRPIKMTFGAMLALAVVLPAGAAQFKAGEPNDRAAVEQLQAGTGAKLALNDATGTVRFARAPEGGSLAQAGNQTRADHAYAFLGSYGKAFGLRNARTDLVVASTSRDKIGTTRVRFLQVYRGVPVFGAMLNAHYDAAGNLKAVNGTVIPDLNVNIVPSKSAAQAGAAALSQVPGKGVTVRGTRMMIFREGLTKGVPGENHLAFEVEVGNGGSIREFVYVDAHSGKPIEQITGIFDALNRRAYDSVGATAPGPNYPLTPYWVEGNSFPTASTEANNMILASKETYDFYKSAFGRDSFDGAGATMDSIFNRGNACPNASWNGTFISFCPGLTTDDVTAHEWSHAYTQYTHGLIYAWQSGALNEAYSDIFGETVDRLNGRMTDTPNSSRIADQCSIYGGKPPIIFTVDAPSPIAGSYFAIPAAFGPATALATGTLTLVNDGVGATGDACQALVGFPAGNIALLDRGTCAFVVKVKNAQNAGAIGAVVANNQAGNLSMGGSDPTITIPSLGVSQAYGTLFKANLPAPVTLNFPAASDNSVRWLIGEDDTAAGLTGPLRDMWNPRCYGNPGKITDAEYTCSSADNGGVHGNSGVPNHGYALLVDGGTYNGQTVAALGLTKAAHIYFRAESVYQVPTSNFADHADALQQSCSDLVGVNLADLQTGSPSGQVINSTDCQQVSKMALAVELRKPPTQCGFLPLLAQSPPAQCAAGTTKSAFFTSSFENTGGSWMDRWTWSRSAVEPAEFVARDWQLVGNLPNGRAGHAFKAPDPNIGTCGPTDNQAGILYLYSPVITVPTVPNAKLSYDHWVATEAGWDGGNVSISVNGGAWQPVAKADYTYNTYNRTLNAGTPLGGQWAFSGADAGTAGSGTWGRSMVNVGAYATSGAKVQLRFNFSSDECGGRVGWYVDDVTMYSCKTGRTPAP